MEPADKPYRVIVGNGDCQQPVYYFATLDEATKFTSAHFNSTGEVLGIEDHRQNPLPPELIEEWLPVE